ncbi:hypothetical protein FQZ97_1094770 [compost metagenome]
MTRPMTTPLAAPTMTARIQPSAKAPAPASAPPLACSTQASVSPAILAVKVTARFRPPVRIGSSIASVSSPSSGSWNATEPKVAALRNWGDARPNTRMTATSARPGPAISGPSHAFRRSEKPVIGVHISGWRRAEAVRCWYWTG